MINWIINNFLIIIMVIVGGMFLKNNLKYFSRLFNIRIKKMENAKKVVDLLLYSLLLLFILSNIPVFSYPGKFLNFSIKILCKIIPVVILLLLVKPVINYLKRR